MVLRKEREDHLEVAAKKTSVWMMERPGTASVRTAEEVKGETLCEVRLERGVHRTNSRDCPAQFLLPTGVVGGHLVACSFPSYSAPKSSHRNCIN